MSRIENEFGGDKVEQAEGGAGFSVAAYCRRESISEASYYYWKTPVWRRTKEKPDTESREDNGHFRGDRSARKTVSRQIGSCASEWTTRGSCRIVFSENTLRFAGDDPG